MWISFSFNCLLFYRIHEVTVSRVAGNALLFSTFALDWRIFMVWNLKI